MSNSPTDTATDQFRDEYSEYTGADGVVAVIADPQNDQAWIASTLTRVIKQ